jgi:hypothetical protein
MERHVSLYQPSVFRARFSLEIGVPFVDGMASKMMRYCGF